MLLSINSLLPLKWQFPSWKLSPHLESKNTYTAESSRSDYINRIGIITVALDKNYSTIIRTLDQDGNCVLEQYFDNNGNPAILISGNSALRREYDAKGQWVTSTYLDCHLNPVVGENGYASVHRTYRKNGKEIVDMFFDEKGSQTIDIYKRYGVRYEYNENEQISVVISLDAYGNPMNNINHFSISKRTYTTNGKLYAEMFYDSEGYPAKLKNGQYGYIYENGRQICLDQYGHKKFVFRHFLLNSAFAVLLIGFSLLVLIMLSNNRLIQILLLMYLTFIVYMTMIDREVGTCILTWSIPPNYYLFFTDREILANIWLFIPFGAIIYKLSHAWQVIIISMTLSFIIEITQYIFHIGAFELSDLIANSLGGIIGIMICYTLEHSIKSFWNKLRTQIFL